MKGQGTPPGAYTTVKMKDGRTFYGIIWTWRPKEGYFTIPSDESAPDRIMLDDVESGTTENERIRIDLIADQDILAHAREGGWVPKDSNDITGQFIR